MTNLKQVPFENIFHSKNLSNGGSVGKAKINIKTAGTITKDAVNATVQSNEAFNGQLESGGVIAEPVNPYNKADGAAVDAIKPKPKGIDPVVVITLIAVAGLITWGVVAILQEREMYSDNNLNKNN